MRCLLSAALAVLILSGCNDEDPSANEPLDPIQILKLAHVRDLATALTQAYEEFERRNFDVVIALCNYVLSREPEYCVAVEFAEDAEKTKARFAEGDEFYFSFLMSKVLNWKKLTDSGPEARLPYVGGDAGDVLTYPHLGLPGSDAPPRSVGYSKMD